MAAAAMTAKPLAAQARATGARRAVVAQAAGNNESRRAALGALLGGAAALVAGKANAIDLFDDRKARDNGFDIIYEARDLTLTQAQRDGIAQARNSLDATKKRIAESARRVEGKLPSFVEKQYWTLAREELRGQLGNLRFDLNTAAGALGKDSRKAALALKADFLKEADALDYAIRKKDAAKANAALAKTKAALEAAIAALG